MSIAENREAWATALETTTTEQGKYRLEYREAGAVKACCLGILCRVYIDAGNDLPVAHQPIDDEGRQVTQFGMSEIAFTPGQVSTWAGIHQIEQHFSRMNDVDGKSFKEIAEFIRTLD